jgi:murein DD-endopeptidase MepM/ murein hydrolase activator NlpD
MSATARRTHLHVVIATGDGARTFRLTIPRWLLRGSAALTCSAVAGLTFLFADYAEVRAIAQASAHLRADLAAQRDTIEHLRGGLKAVRKDIETWPALHARILSPFGRPAAAFEATPPGGDDVAETTSTVRRATGTLRQVAGLITRFDNVLAQMPTAYPVRAAITSEFGQRQSPWGDGKEFHAGLDIAAPAGTEVHAPASGAIAFSGPHGAYGLTVIVDHGENVRTLYGHLSRVSVKPGERVQRGQVLGRAGSTGRSTGAHLHYEVIVAGRTVNPRPYLWD